MLWQRSAKRATPLFFVLLALFAVFGTHSASLAAPIATEIHDISTASGVRWEFQPEAGDWKTITVPGGGWRAQGYTCDAGTYRTVIAVPSEAVDKTVRVVFAAINFGAEVFAGPDSDHLTKVAAHIDGWVPVTAEVSAVAIPGKPLVLQVVVKGRHKFMVGGKYTVPEGATWDSHLEEGILRGVTLEVLPRVHIHDAVVRTTTAPAPLFQAYITVRNDSARPVRIRLDATLSSASRHRFSYPRLKPIAENIAPGASLIISLGSATWLAGRESYWWPNVPYRSDYRAVLHNLDIALSVDGKPVHTYRQRFGFRSFVVSGNHYLLNDVRCNLRGDNQQEADFDTDAYGIRPGFGPPSPGNGGWPKAVDNLLRLNFNVLRIHQIPATPYMLDVCDERGLMLVDESPLRGSEGGESYKDGKENMLAMDRELVVRDRNHPAIVIWSAANEWPEPIRDTVDVIRYEDGSRPIIADGIGDMGPDVINMEHYVNGVDGMPVTGGHPRADRPYGETEAVWSRDNTLQGFAWMATTIRTRRLKGDADLRNYVLNNVWPNYVPGEGPERELLEKRVKHMDNNATILPSILDPWNDPHIVLMQRCYNPVAACDIGFDRVNARSNKNGDWPVTKPRLVAGTHTTRTIAVFNDEFSDRDVTLHYAFHRGSNASGPVLARGERKLTIAPGEFAEVDLPLDVPAGSDDVTLTLATEKAGGERFHEDRMFFRVGSADAVDYPAGSYRLVSHLSDLPAVAPTGNAASAIALGRHDEPVFWRLEYVGDPKDGNLRLIDDSRKSALAIESAPGIDGTNAVEKPVDADNPAQIWHLTVVDEGVITLKNQSSGKLLDVYARATTRGSRIVQWADNGGENQQWELRPK